MAELVRWLVASMRESPMQAWMSALRLFREWYADLIEDFNNRLNESHD